MSGHLSVTPYVSGHGAAVRASLGATLDHDSGFRAFWENLFDAPTAAALSWQIALRDGKVVGQSIVFPRPVGPRGGRMTFQFGTDGDTETLAALRSATDAAARQHGVRDLYQSFPVETDAPNTPPDGYAFYLRMRRFAIPTDFAEVPAQPGIRVRLYRGGEKTVDEGLAILGNQTMGPDPFWFPVDGPRMGEIVSIPGSDWFIAEDEDSGQVVGVVELILSQRFYSTIAISRRYWGKGVAERMVFESLSHARSNGLDTINSIVRTTNAASISLHRRANAKHVGDMLCYVRDVPSAS